MTTINFPSSPTTGQTYTFEGRTWEFDGVAWNLILPTLSYSQITSALGYIPLNQGSNLYNSENVFRISNGTSNVFSVSGDGNITLEGTLISNGSSGSAGYLLTSNGTSTYWSAPGSVVIAGAGSNTEIQFNDSGVLNATPGFTFDKTTNTVTVTNTVIVDTVQSSNGTTNLKLTTGNTSGPNLVLIADHTYYRAFFSMGSNSVVGIGNWSNGSEIDFYSPATNNNVGYIWGEETSNEVGRYVGIGSTANGGVHFWSNAAAQMYLVANGNFGVGTATPSYKLEVNGTIKGTSFSETVYAISGTTPTISGTNGTIQTWTLTGSSTPTDGLADGESITLMINDGTAYTITWTSLVDQWIGGAAPTLATTGYSVVELWKVAGTVYGASVGDLS